MLVKHKLKVKEKKKHNNYKDILFGTTAFKELTLQQIANCSYAALILIFSASISVLFKCFCFSLLASINESNSNNLIKARSSLKKKEKVNYLSL